MSKKHQLNALKAEHALHWYQIERVLGHGAFGITYLAHDVNLDRAVAIKEYMPSQLCARADDLSVQPLSDKHKEDFQWGLTRFIDEARTLTRFEHPNLVRVFNVFELNNTAYMVMNYEVGESLQQILKRKKTLSEKELTRILLPLMSGLELIHEKGFIHRDIKPGNVFIRHDGSPVLLDFGSARQTRGRGEPQTLTNFVSPGYAPIEQYTSKSDRQGPWTDIYGLGATLYRAITGVSPTTAIDRSEMIMNGIDDDYKSLSELMQGRYSDKFLAAIDHALSFNAQDRPKTIAEWRLEFEIDEEEIDTLPANAVDVPGDDEATLKLDQDAPPTFATATVKNPGHTASEATTINIAGTVEELHTIAMTLGARLRQWLRKDKVLATTMAAVLVLAATLGILYAGRDGRDTATATDSTSATATAESAAEERDAMAADSGDGSGMETVAMAENTDAGAGIEELLTRAEADIEALRLMTPKGNNAYERYQRVLAEDPDNERAAQGLEAISDKYVQLAYGAMESGNLERADLYLRRAGRVTPDSPGIASARSTLQARVAEQEEGGGNVVDDVMNWFKEKTAGESKPPPKESTSSENVRRALGGR